MLSFFEMLSLLEARAKRKTAKDALVDAGTATPAEVEPAVPAAPQYSKENPHPSYGTITTHASGRMVDTPTGRVWQDYTPEERKKAEEELTRSTGTANQANLARNEKAIEAERKAKALRDYQAAWSNFTTQLQSLQASGKSDEEITSELGSSFQTLNAAARAYDPRGVYDKIEDAISDASYSGDEADPFTGGEDAKPVSQLSKKEMEKIRKEEEARRRAAETKMGATGDITTGAAKYAGDLVLMWNDWMKGRTYRVFTKMAIKDLGIKVDGPAVVSGALEPDSDEYFKIALYESRGDKSGPDEIIMTARDFLKVNKWVKENLGFEGRPDSSFELNVSFRQAVAAGLESDPDMSAVVLRALKLEKYILNPQIVGKETTIAGLAEMLSKLAKTDVVGGLDPVKESDDLNQAAVSYMITVAKTSKRVQDAAIASSKRALGARMFAGKKATVVTAAGPVTRANAGIGKEDGPEMGRQYQKKFDIFEVEPNADLSDPNTKVRVKERDEMAEIDTRDDNPYAKRTYVPNMGRAVDRARLAFGGGKKSAETPSLPEPQAAPEKPKLDLDLESTDLSDLMTVLEYWNK